MAYLSLEKIEELKIKANEIRQSLIEMLVEAGSGHTAGSLGMVDIFTLFYFHVLRHDPVNPLWEDRDRLILSHGHICPGLYATMAHAGYFPIAELKTLRKLGSRLQGHPHREFLPFMETSSGPLGSGLSQAVGMAIALRIDGKDGSSLSSSERFIYCCVSDGELDEGNSWEAIMLAGKYKLRNLIVIVDRNYIQIEGDTENVLPLEPLTDKWRAFNWHVFQVAGHDFKKINEKIELAKESNEGPTVIIAHTIPGKGVKEFENNYKWHGKTPNKKEGEMAINELKAESEKLQNEK